MFKMAAAQCRQDIVYTYLVGRKAKLVVNGDFKYGAGMFELDN